jgi:dual specificity phosphatase 12
VFLEPISWMADQVVGPVQGKLYCPKCSARLGSFNWAGGYCLGFR